MATLVLSTIGTALGGPVGSAIGALIGQSIDQEIFAPKGPKVSDLRVQTSSYGTQMPRIYGTMRAAGTVIWSTDLVPHAQSGGAKGQSSAAYTYTVSFAVAISSRPATSIGRIWADGNLLRGAAGDLKVGGKLRFCSGGEDQIIDPLIGSVEGIANTPAYRGLALAVFEDLELATYGNRIPVLTFEIVADSGPVTVGSVLADASAGEIAANASDVVLGYAAYGRSIREAVQPLIDSFGVQLFDAGVVLRSNSDAATVIGDDEFGNSANQQQTPRLQREQAAARTLPARLRLTYYEPQRDYQTGQARASVTDQSGIETQQDLAAALDAGSAKALAQQIIARAWSRRDKLTLKLPPKRLTLEPGSTVSLPLSPSDWTVDQVTIDGFVVSAELYPAGATTVSMIADPGRVNANLDVVAGPLSLAVLDVPNVLGLASASPMIFLAASDATAGWKSSLIDVGFSGQDIPSQTAPSKSVLGKAVTALPVGGTDLVDTVSTVDVALIDQTQWLTSCDDDALAAGHNLAMLGSEVIQFGQALPIGNGAFRLSRLLRGRGGTEWACSGHEVGEDFCLLQANTLQSVELPSWSIGATLDISSTAGATTSILYSGEGVRPPSPVNLTAQLQPGGALLLTWTRRSRQGFAWVDEIDAPLGETIEQYRINLGGSASVVEPTASQPSLMVDSGTVAALGAGQLNIQVRQIGDFAVSHPAQITINLA